MEPAVLVVMVVALGVMAVAAGEKGLPERRTVEDGIRVAEPVAMTVVGKSLMVPAAPPDLLAPVASTPELPHPVQRGQREIAL